MRAELARAPSSVPRDRFEINQRFRTVDLPPPTPNPLLVILSPSPSLYLALARLKDPQLPPVRLLHRPIFNQELRTDAKSRLASNSKLTLRVNCCGISEISHQRAETVVQIRAGDCTRKQSFRFANRVHLLVSRSRSVERLNTGRVIRLSISEVSFISFLFLFRPAKSWKPAFSAAREIELDFLISFFFLPSSTPLAAFHTRLAFSDFPNVEGGNSCEHLDLPLSARSAQDRGYFCSSFFTLSYNSRRESRIVCTL